MEAVLGLASFLAEVCVAAEGSAFSPRIYLSSLSFPLIHETSAARKYSSSSQC